MRRFLSFIAASALILMFTQKIQARDYQDIDFDYFPHSEFYLQYGTPTAVEFMGKTNNVITDSDPTYTIVCESRNHKYSGAAGIGYRYSLSPRFVLGISGGFSWSQADFYTTSVNGQSVNEYLATSSIRNWTVMADAHFAWWQEGMMELSSGLYLGVSIIDQTLKNSKLNEEDDRSMFAYHITAVKFRIGETVGGFAELGYGYRGIVNIGLSIRL